MADDKNTNKFTGGNNESSPDTTLSEEAPVITPNFNLPTGGNFNISVDPFVESEVDGRGDSSGTSGKKKRPSVSKPKKKPGVDPNEPDDEPKDGFQTDPRISTHDLSLVVPPKSTASVNKLIESSTSAVLTDKGVFFKDSTDVVKKNKTLYDYSDLTLEGNYNTSSLTLLDIVVIHFGFDGLPKFVEAFTANPGLGYIPSIKISSSLQGDVDYLILDIIPFVSTPGSSDSERPRFGGNFSLDPSNPYTLSLPNLGNIEFEPDSLHQYLSYTPSTNHLRVSWAQLSSNGISDMDLKLNFIDRSVESGSISQVSNVFHISSTENIGDTFQSFIVKIDKSGADKNHRIICSEPERYDFVPYLNIENPRPLDNSGFNREVKLTLSRNLESKSKVNGDYFTRLDIDHETSFSSLPIIEVRDRQDVISIKRPMSSNEGTLRFYTRSFYEGYVFDDDSSIFHDQFIERRLSHNIIDTKEGYTIFSINDNLGVLSNSVWDPGDGDIADTGDIGDIADTGDIGDTADSDYGDTSIGDYGDTSIGDYGDTSIGDYDHGYTGDTGVVNNDIEFRREYISSELTNEEERRDIKSNYFLYMNKDTASSSEKLNPIINIEIDSRVSENITCSLGYKLIIDGSKTKDNFSIKLISLTRIGDLNNPMTFAKELSIEWDESDLFPYGKYTTYGSGNGSAADGFALRCLCIKDLYNILSSNLYGKINKSNPYGSLDSDTVGFFPTLGELYPDQYPEGSSGFNSSIVKISMTKEYSGHYLLPLSRIWLGNTTGNNYESLIERNIIHISNYESSDPYVTSPSHKDRMYCRGLEKNISLEKFTVMSPLARKLGAPGVRSSIKTYISHLSSGDFETISSGGAGDSRFYKWNTVRDFVDILREGDQFASVTKSLKDSESSNMFGRKCQTNNYVMGTKRKLIGLASLGVPLYYYDDDRPVFGDEGWGVIPSYVISNMFSGDRKNPTALEKYVDDWIPSDGEVNFAYGSYSSFDAAGSSDGDVGLVYSLWKTRNNVVDWQEDLYPHGFTNFSGGIWWIVYSTFNEIGNNVDGNYGKNTRQMLDPFLFGSEYQIMFEGGDDVLSSTRNISNVYIFDNSVDNESLLPDYNNIYNYINDTLQAKITSGSAESGQGLRLRGGAYFYYLKSNGSFRVNGKGPINYSVSFLRDQSRDPSKIYITEGQNERSITAQSFDVIQEMRSLFGSSLTFESSADFDLQDIFPLWTSVFPGISTTLPPTPYGEPEMIVDDFHPDNPYSSEDPYLINIIETESISDDEDVLIDPYAPVSGIDVSVLTGELIYVQSVSLRMGDSTDVLYRKFSINTSLFEFYLNRDKYRTVHDLSDDINRKLLSKGVRFTNLLSYSRFYTPDRILATDDDLEIIKISSLTRNIHGLTLYGGTKHHIEYITGDYGTLSTTSDNVFSLNVLFKRNDTLSSITSIVENNLIGETNENLPIGLRRNRYRDDVQSLLRSYISNRTEQSSRLIEEVKRNSDLQINVGSYAIGSNESKFDSPHVAHQVAGAESGVGLQVSLGGFVKNGDFIIFDAPNSYFEHNYNIFFPLSFSIKDADIMILLVRIRNEDGTYNPDSGDLLSSYRASVSYSNGILPEFTTGVSQSQIPGANFTEYEDGSNGEIDEVSPAVLSIPLRAPINNVLIKNDFNNLETSVKITNSPESLDEFGFLAINRNNFSFNMQESKVSNSFGLVLDFLGAWDILISPEAIVNRQPNGVFNYLGLGYNRRALDTDEAFIAGVGLSEPDPDNIDVFNQYLNDIFIDPSVLPDEVQDSIRMLPVPGYPKVFVLQIDPGVKNYLAEQRNFSGSDPNSQQACFLDIPLFFHGKDTGAEGTCSVRVFLDTSCIEDYNLCDYFWNLSSPPSLAGPETISNYMEVSFFDYGDCVDESYRDENDNIISRHYVDCLISKVPMLDSGSSLVLIKSPKNTLNISNFFKPPEEVLDRIVYVSGPSQSENAPWELECDNLTYEEVTIINKPIIYTNSGDLSIYTSSVSDIMDILESEDSYMFINPQFALIDEDIKGNCYSDEQIVLGIGMSFRNWRIGPDSGFPLRLVIGVEAVLPSNIISEFSIPFCIKYLYNEDRKVR